MTAAGGWINKLYYGDCLSIMREMPKNYVDLVYLEPPFNSNREYAAIYEDDTGRPLPEQVDAFEDRWELSEERLRAIQAMPVLVRETGIPDDVADFWQLWMRALRKANPRLLAYLSYMTERLLPLRSIVKPTGSMYLHCDPTASHYIKDRASRDQSQHRDGKHGWQSRAPSSLFRGDPELQFVARRKGAAGDRSRLTAANRWWVQGGSNTNWPWQLWPPRGPLFTFCRCTLWKLPRRCCSHRASVLPFASCARARIDAVVEQTSRSFSAFPCVS